MAALTRGRMTDKLGFQAVADAYDYDIGTGVKVYAGAMIVINAAGYAVPATSAATHLACPGIAMKEYDTSTSNGQFKIAVYPGIYKFANSGAADAITRTEINAVCYAVDDQTVAKTDGTGTRSVAGHVVAVDSDGVWVQLGIGLPGIPVA